MKKYYVWKSSRDASVDYQDVAGTSYLWDNTHLKNVKPGEEVIFYYKQGAVNKFLIAHAVIGEIETKSPTEKYLATVPGHANRVTEVYRAYYKKYTKFLNPIEITLNDEGKRNREYLGLKDLNGFGCSMRRVDHDFFQKCLELAGHLTLSSDIEDLVYGHITETDLNPQKRQHPKITKEQLKSKQEAISEIGRKGEEYVYFYLKQQKDQGKIKSFEWVSDVDPLSPYDFKVNIDNATEILIDVKSTSGEFERNLFISSNEILTMSDHNQRYDIYRVFSINDLTATAQLRIAENIREFSLPIINSFNKLPIGVKPNGFTVQPSKSHLSFGEEITIKQQLVIS